jgi:Uma2 family endonuclease
MLPGFAWSALAQRVEARRQSGCEGCIIAAPGQEEGAPLSWRPSADAVAGNGAPLNWCRSEAEKAARNPSTDAVAGENVMQVSQSSLRQNHIAVDDVERYEVIDGVRVEQEPMGAFETVLASWLCYRLNSFAVDKKLGLAVSEVLFVLNAQRNLRRRPDVAFVSYARWPTPVMARASAWNVVPDLAVEMVSPSNLAEEIDSKITDYFQSGVRLVWVFYPDSGRVYVYQSPTQVSILERTDTLDGGEVFHGFQLHMAQLYAAVTRPE